MQKPKAIYFDWDGTLVDTLDFVFSAHNHVRAALGEKPWSRDEFYEQMKQSSVKLYPVIYGDRAAQASGILTSYLTENHLLPGNIRILDGVSEALRRFDDDGIAMGVVSNKRHQFVVREVEAMGFQDYFRSVIGAGVTATDKPTPAPLLRALGDSGIMPGGDVWFVGDTEPDVLCARAAGCTAVLLHQGRDHTALIRTHKPEIVVRDMAELAGCLPD